MSVAARLAAHARADGSARGAAPPSVDEGAGFSLHEHGPRCERGRDPHSVAVTSALARVSQTRGCGDAPPLFFDLETTGLGPKAVPFLVGLAGFHPDGSAWVRQWQLADLAGERSMWLAVVDALCRRAPGARLVTYNGASFDRTVVRLRLRRLGLWTEALDQSFGEHHVDLLPVCRRLWRSTLPDVRLLTLEREVLGTVRVGDPSGLEIAELGQRWLDGARDANTRAGIAAARQHNADDLLGLASLVVACAAVLESPTSLGQALGAARHLTRSRGTPSSHARVLLEAWQGNALRDPVVGVEMLLLQVATLRRAGEFDQAHAVLVEICTRHRGHPEATTRLAIDCEHRLRRADLALEWLRTVERPCPRRLARLLAKQPVVSGPTTESAAAPPAKRVDAVPGSWRANVATVARRALAV